MYKRIFLALFLTWYISGCKEVPEQISEIPPWLNEKIEFYNSTCVYYGTSVTRYKWEQKYIYEFYVPILDCPWCEMYFENGDSLIWGDTLSTGDTLILTDYLEDRILPKTLWLFDDENCLEPYD